MTTTCTMILGDCLDVMSRLPFADLIVADLPFGVSSYAWDSPLDLSLFWPQTKGATVLAFANLSFLRALIDSNPKNFKFEIIWDQMRGWNPFLAKKMPMRAHHYIVVFSSGSIAYYPQMTDGHKRVVATKGSSINKFYGETSKEGLMYDSTKRHPTSILRFKPDVRRRNNKTGTRLFDSTHPSTKPVGLLSWMIKSFCAPGKHVIDPTSGSASTAIAAIDTGRKTTCIEKDEVYFEAGVERVRKHIRDNLLDVKLEVRK